MNKAGKITALRGVVGAILVALAVVSLAVSAAEQTPASSTGTQKASSKATQPATTQKNKKKAEPQPELVDINSANKATLKTLPSIGDAEADKIIAGRPYTSKADLVTKNILPAGVYQSLKRQIIAKQPTTPQPGRSTAKKSPTKTSTTKNSTAPK